MIEDVGIYKTLRYTAYIYPKKIIICTHLQSFRIVCENYQSYVYLNHLKLAIINGEIRTITQIAEHTEKEKLKWENCKPLSNSLLAV